MENQINKFIYILFEFFLNVLYKQKAAIERVGSKG